MDEKKKENKKGQEVIAVRKTCSAQGTGLSHYILLDGKSK
jgi:modified peptide precursor CbpA